MIFEKINKFNKPLLRATKKNKHQKLLKPVIKAGNNNRS